MIVVLDISPYPQSATTILEVNLREVTSSLQFINQIIYHWEWTLILYGDLVELRVIDTHSKGTILFPQK